MRHSSTLMAWRLAVAMLALFASVQPQEGPSFVVRSRGRAGTGHVAVLAAWLRGYVLEGPDRCAWRAAFEHLFRVWRQEGVVPRSGGPLFVRARDFRDHHCRSRHGSRRRAGVVARSCGGLHGDGDAKGLSPGQLGNQLLRCRRRGPRRTRRSTACDRIVTQAADCSGHTFWRSPSGVGCRGTCCTYDGRYSRDVDAGTRRCQTREAFSLGGRSDAGLARA